MTPTERKRLARIERRLARDCEWAIRNGWKIARGSYVAPDANCCCVLGALGVRLLTDDFAGYEASIELGIATSEAWAISDGFEWDDIPNPSEWNQIGARLRGRYVTP